MKQPLITLLLLYSVLIVLYINSCDGSKELGCTVVSPGSSKTNTSSNSGVCEDGHFSCSIDEACTASQSVQTFEYFDAKDALPQCNKKFPSGPASSKPFHFNIKHSLTPNVNDPFFFLLELDWDNWPKAVGYHVTIEVLPLENEGNSAPPKYYAYKCINGSDASNVTIPMEYGYPIAYSSCQTQREFLVEIIGLPISSTVSPYTRRLAWPDNCFSIANESVCGPRRPVGANISILSHLLPNESTLMSSVITWSNPLNTIFNDTKYNIILYKDGDHVADFKVADSRSVRLSPLDATTSYTLYLEPLQPGVCQYECFSDQIGRYNCGPFVSKIFSYIPPASVSSYSDSLSMSPSLSPSPSPSVSVVTSSLSTSSSASLSTSLVSTDVSQSMRPASSLANSKNVPLAHGYLTIIMVAAGVLLFVLLVLSVFTIVVILTIRHMRSRDCVDQGEDILKPGSSDESSASTTRSPTPSSPWSPLPTDHCHYVFPEGAATIMEPATILEPIVEPIYYKEPSCRRPDVKVVLVIESLRLSEFESNVNCSFLGDKLNKYPGLHVLHYNTSIRKTPSEWLMNNMMKADVVLCLCCKEFLEEWESKACAVESLVHPLKSYVVGEGNVGNSLSDKYMIVLHSKEQEKFIPVVLNSLKRCIISETDELYRLITQTPNRLVVSS